MWGLWLVVGNTEVQQHQQQLVGWPTADPKVVWKSSSFDEKSTVNIWLFSSGRQANFCSVQFHYKAQLAVYSLDHMLEGSAHTPLRDTRCGKKTRTGSSRCGPRKQTSLIAKGWLNSCQEVSPPKDKRWNWPCWQQERHDTVQWTICCARGTWLWQGAWSTKLCTSTRSTEHFKVPGALWYWGAMNLDCWISQGQTIFVSQFFALLPHSRLELGHCSFS